MREKKSETLEVRLPHSQKRAFMRICVEEGTTASDEVRGFIDRFLARRGRSATEPMKDTLTMIRNHPKKAFATVAATLAIGAALGARPSLAGGDPFALLDTNADGVLTATDLGQTGDAAIAVETMLTRLDLDGSGAVTREEFEAGVTPIDEVLDGLDPRVAVVSVVSTVVSTTEKNVDLEPGEFRVRVLRLGEHAD